MAFAQSRLCRATLGRLHGINVVPTKQEKSDTYALFKESETEHLRTKADLARLASKPPTIAAHRLYYPSVYLLGAEALYSHMVANRL